MKLLSLSTLAASLLFLMSVNGVAVDKDAKPLAPNFSVENEFGVCSVSKSDGKYLLLQFWDGTDAASRVKNIEASKLIASSKADTNFEYAGIYTGSDKTLYEAALLNDDVDVKQQYFLGDDKDSANIYADYSLSSGNHTFLIAPNGRIVAINPSQEEILTLTKNKI